MAIERGGRVPDHQDRPDDHGRHDAEILRERSEPHRILPLLQWEPARPESRRGVANKGLRHCQDYLRDEDDMENFLRLYFLEQARRAG